MPQPRLNYDESIARLQELGALGPDERPPMPDHVPQPEDDEPLGLSFFRTFLGDGADLSDKPISENPFGHSSGNQERKTGRKKRRSTGIQIPEPPFLSS